MIGMWGSRLSGKTTYLIALYYEVLQRKDRDERWAMWGHGDAAQKFIVEGYKSFVGQHFPDFNDPRNTIESLQFEITKPWGESGTVATPVTPTRGKWLSMAKRFLKEVSLGDGGDIKTSILLDLFDPAGELFSEPEKLMSDAFVSAAACRQMLGNSSGLLCMIDPDREKDTYYFPLIFQNFVNLSKIMNGDGGGPLPIPVAICVTKCDKYLDAFQDPRAFLRRHLGLAAFSALSDFCEQKEFFALSAIGQNNLIVDPNGISRPAGEPKPENVLQPLEWLNKVMR